MSMLSQGSVKYVISFDESLNKVLQSEQMDISFDFGTTGKIKYAADTLTQRF